MLTHLAAALLVLVAIDSTVKPVADPHVDVRIDSVHREVVLTVAGITLDSGMAYLHQRAETNVPLTWPVRGSARGYDIEVLDASGQRLPRTVLHHAGIANLDRRALTYPVAERVLAAGRETQAMMLPASMAIPLDSGARMVLYYMLVNPTPVRIEGAQLRITIAWNPAGTRDVQHVYPVFLDAHASDTSSGSFDLPPGRSTSAAEFTLPLSGHLRAVGGHVHDHAVELRLEDAESDAVLARLVATTAADGRLEGITTDRFVLKRKGLALEANHRYRVVSVYDNRTGAVIPSGAMAFMVGPFIPDDAKRWPAVDPTDPRYAADFDGFFKPRPASDSHADHSHHM